MAKKPKSQDELEIVADQIQEELGAEAVQLGLDTDKIVICPSIPTGSLALDAALGIGGVPRGRVIEIYGPESSGKTTLALTIVLNAQRAGGAAAYIDAEHALDPTWMKRIGVDLGRTKFLMSQPDSAE